MKEFVIWGITPNSSDERLLLVAIKGMPITNKYLANKWADRLKEIHKCTNVRVQEINLSNGFNNDFKKAI